MLSDGLDQAHNACGVMGPIDENSRIRTEHLHPSNHRYGVQAGYGFFVVNFVPLGLEPIQHRQGQAAIDRLMLAGSGTRKCSKRLVGVVRHIRVCGPCSRDDSNR